MSLLDEIVFQPAVMQPLPAAEPTPVTSVSFGPAGSARPLQALAPWMVCHTTPEQAGARWVDLCSRLHARGLFIECSVPALEKVPVTSIPRRLFRQSIHIPIDVENVHAADIIEVTCQSPLSSVWGWPPEIESSSNLPLWLSAVRRVIGGQTPLGIGITDGVGNEAIRAMIDCQVDFITLHSGGSVEFLIETLSRIRRALDATGSTASIIVRTKASSIDHLLKILALGANAVSVDAALSDLWSSGSSSMSSFLGTRLPVGVSAPSAPCPIAERLDKLQGQLLSTMQVTGATSIAGLRQTLRALSTAAARLASVSMIGD